MIKRYNIFAVLTLWYSLVITSCANTNESEKFVSMDFNIDNSVLSPPKVILGSYSIQLPIVFNAMGDEIFKNIKQGVENQETYILKPEVIEAYSDTSNNIIIFSKLNESDLLQKLENDFTPNLRDLYPEKFAKSYFSINNIQVVYFQLYNKDFRNHKIFLLDGSGFQLDFMIKNNRYREYSRFIESSIGTLKRNNTKENTNA